MLIVVGYSQSSHDEAYHVCNFFFFLFTLVECDALHRLFYVLVVEKNKRCGHTTETVSNLFTKMFIT